MFNKFPDLYHHGYHGYYHKREAEADAHGYYIECEKEMKTVCKKTPVKEEVNKEFELCRPKPNEVDLISKNIYAVLLQLLLGL